MNQQFLNLPWNSRLGKPFSCKGCGQGYTRKRKFKKHCVSKSHLLLFKHWLEDVGHVEDRHKRPWGCPSSHKGEISRVSNTGQPVQSDDACQGTGIIY